GRFINCKGRPMRRGPKPEKSKEGKPPVAPMSPKDDSARVRDLEKRLAEALEREAGALKREAEALGQLQTRDRELSVAREQLTAAHTEVSETHDQQTATAEILRVISSLPTDVQPVFDAIAQSALRLCNANFCAVARYDGEQLYLAAHAHV